MLRAVLDGAEQIGVDTQQLGEHLGIEPVTFAVVLVNGSQLAGIGHGDMHAPGHLRNTEVSDEGLEKLRDLTNLRELYLFETKISDEGGNKLRSELPNATIEW